MQERDKLSAHINTSYVDGLPLHTAVKTGANGEFTDIYGKIIRVDERYNVVLKLLEEKCNPNLKDEKGWTPLHYACELDDLKSINSLLKYRADPNARNNDNQTPLHIAAANSSLNAVVALVRAKVDINAQDKFLCTALHYSTIDPSHTQIAFLLLYGAINKIPNQYGLIASDYLSEQEIRNIVWIAECIAQQQKDRIQNFIPI